jgi:heme/copper-type cytochrome/quinol oxidase subunit 3
MATNIKTISYNRHEHPFHLVKSSPWPFYTALPLFIILLDAVKYFHHYQFSKPLLYLALFVFFFSVTHWFWDIIVEATFEGHHNSYVRKGLRLGFALFILSEVMFFFSFFWSFFHYSVSPSVWIGNTWPPLGIKTINPWGLPLLNTVILLSSGVTVTWAHKAILPTSRQEIEKLYAPYFDEKTNRYYITLNTVTNFEHQEFFETVRNLLFFHNKAAYKELLVADLVDGLTLSLNFKMLDLVVRSQKRHEVTLALTSTVLYGLLFTALQLHEYNHAPFSMNDSVYGSIFYLTTGFHGFHVIIGTLFLIVCLIRHIYYHFTSEHHLGLEMAIWYWHFVDVVWLFLFICIYWWGS